MKFVAALAGIALFSSAAWADDMSGPGPIRYAGSQDHALYVQLLGGIVQNLDVSYNYNDSSSYPTGTKWGYAVAGTVGMQVLDGVALEADVLHSTRDLEERDGDVYSTTSLMANVKLSAMLTDTVSIYGAAGLGYVWGQEEYGVAGLDKTESFGYQFVAGVSAQFTDTIAGVVEYRYQDTFEKNNYVEDTDEGLTIPVSTVLAGVKFGF